MSVHYKPCIVLYATHNYKVPDRVSDRDWPEEKQGGGNDSKEATNTGVEGFDSFLMIQFVKHLSSLNMMVAVLDYPPR